MFYGMAVQRLCSLITLEKARELNLKGKAVKLSVVKVGGETEEIDSYKYRLNLIDRNGEIVPFEVYGINRISTIIKEINIEGVAQLFHNVREDEIKRPYGEIDVLIGFEYAGYHPVRKQP